MAQRIAPFSVSSFSLLVALTTSVIACSKSRDEQPSPGDRASTEYGSSTGGATSTGVGATPGDDASIVVNGVALSAQTVQQLQQVYPVTVPPGRYWYDAVSGAWGREGEPIAGQMIPNLSLGGALAANASGGTSGVFINGRQITGGEKSYIERLCQTPVAPARYWVMANGVGGYEGAPAAFNLAQCPGVQQQSGGGARSMSRTYCDANGACTSTGILGSITTAVY